ncbi:response regulator PleD [compost metagenome]
MSKDPETSAIPVLIVTTKDQETDRIWAQRQGARGFVTKPVEEDALIAKLNEVLGA